MTPAIDAASAGAAAGLEVRSPLRFASLRPGSGEPLDVTESDGLEGRGETLITWEARPDNPFRGRLLRDGRTFWFWASDAGWYRIDPARSEIVVGVGSDPLRRELRMFGVPVTLISGLRGDVSIHAAAVEVDGHGILLAGPSRYGKTTLAAAFARSGHRLLCEDTTRCRPESAEIYPGPAALRLRADVGAALSIPGTTVAPTSDAGRVALLFDADRRGSSRPVPLRAIVLVREPTETVRVEPVRPADAARDLLSLAFRLPTASGMAEVFERVAGLTAGVPAVNLHRPMTLASLDEVVENVIEQAVR